MLDRTITKRLTAGKKSVLILGARQVGKTTLLQKLPLVKLINLADEAIFISYAKDPAKLIREVNAMTGQGMIAIDEVQRVPKILNAVQVLIDDHSPFRFILTGSSARKLKRGHANLLPGRIIIEYLDPLTIEEMGGEFDIERALQLGSLPGIYLDRDSDMDLLESYAITYLKEEIQAEALTRSIGSYSRFLDIAAEASGQWINYSKLSNDAEIPKETIRRFFTILEDTLVAFRIPSFRPKRTRRRVSQRDRYIIFDTGVRNALLKLHRSPLSPAEKGSIFEQFAILQTIYYNRSNKKGWEIFSYRTEGGAEVDFIIDAGDSLVAVECKAGRNVSEAELAGFKSFESVAHKPVKKYVIYQGENRQQFSNKVLAVPIRDFFTSEIKKL
ncbi:MAG: ATP-binding protein [Candidatus Margulisbacteria bacterium]|nr:ATP-binding protein [Candidatus Margulisiibacteriota bacterium]